MPSMKASDTIKSHSQIISTLVVFSKRYYFGRILTDTTKVSRQKCPIKTTLYNLLPCTLIRILI